MKPVSQLQSLDVGHYLNIGVKYIVAAFPHFVDYVAQIIGFLNGIALVVSFMLLVGIILSMERLKAIRAKEEEIYDAHVEPAYDESDSAKADPALAVRWQKVLEHAESQNENDWRQAIIEADIMLEDILRKVGLTGDTIGDLLKGADRADFKSLDAAWDAHKVRNRIAHDGSAFSLSQHEAKRVVNLYKQVFEEFFYI